VLVVALMLLVTPQAIALKYTIDGDLSDWGVDLTGDWSLNDTWIPNNGVWYIVEDNNDPDRVWYAPGVHIKGVAPGVEDYDEPPVYVPAYGRYAPPPIGHERWDIEAMYADEDDDFIYIAVVTSQDPAGTSLDKPGDLALNLDGDDTTGEYGYEWGIYTTGPNQSKIIYLPDWSVAYDAPGRIVGILPGGKVNGTAIMVYTRNSTSNYPPDDHGRHNWVIEIAIPKTSVGVKGSIFYEPPFPKKIHLGENCGNDTIDIPIPEFITLLIPAGIILGSVIYFRTRK